MSNIIKNSSLLSEPKIVQLTDLFELQKNLKLDKPNNDNSKKEDEILELKAESEKILKETEQMVIELLEKARSEAKDIINNAQEEADIIRSQVYEEAKIIREQARKEGYEEGLKLANEEIENDRQRALEQSELIIEEARQTKLNMLKSAEADMVRLIMAIAKKVVATEIKFNSDVILHIVREAISCLDNPQNVKVYVNPEQIEKLFDLIAMESLTDCGNKEIEADIKGDSKITVGGCIIESDNGSVDARIDTKILNIEKALQEVAGDE